LNTRDHALPPRARILLRPQLRLHGVQPCHPIEAMRHLTTRLNRPFKPLRIGHARHLALIVISPIRQQISRSGIATHQLSQQQILRQDPACGIVGILLCKAAPHRARHLHARCVQHPIPLHPRQPPIVRPAALVVTVIRPLAAILRPRRIHKRQLAHLQNTSW